MRERDYLRLKKQIEAECREKLNALEVVWKIASGQTARPEAPPRTAVQQLVRLFLNHWRDGEFSLDEVFKYIRQTAPDIVVNRSSISAALRRLALNGEIEIVFSGKGNKPSRYRRVDGSQQAA